MLGITRGTTMHRMLRSRDARRSGDPVRAAVTSWPRLVATWIERARQRRVLATLDDRLLADIGVTRTEAEFEGKKPFWR